MCLICLSAFTTKANCERHLKVHTDTLSGRRRRGRGMCGARPPPWALTNSSWPTGVCHSCGFISTTRDILYSHLVTNHMVCQPGSKGEIYSPGAGHQATKLPPGEQPCGGHPLPLGPPEQREGSRLVAQDRCKPVPPTPPLPELALQL